MESARDAGAARECLELRVEDRGSTLLRRSDATTATFAGKWPLFVGDYRLPLPNYCINACFKRYRAPTRRRNEATLGIEIKETFATLDRNGSSNLLTARGRRSPSCG